MKIAIISESHIDEEALAVLIRTLISRPFAKSGRLAFRSPGCDDILRQIGPIVRACHFDVEVDGLVIVRDSDGAQVHREEHDATPDLVGCFLCRIRHAVYEELRLLTSATRRTPLQIAIGLASPAIEAWYLAGTKPACTEAMWASDLAQGKDPVAIRRELKVRHYGVVRPTGATMRTKALESVERLKTNIQVLQNEFPGGFGALAKSLRLWLLP